MQLKTRFALFVLASIFGAQVPSAFATDLGRALNFVALSTGGNIIFGANSLLKSGAVGGKSVTLGVSSQAGTSPVADVIAKPGGITLQSGASAGNCITGGAKVKLVGGAQCASVDVTGTNGALGTLSGALTDAATYAVAAKSQSPTQHTTIKIPAIGHVTIVDTIPGGLNVIAAPSITIARDGVLKISGGASDTVLLQISGNVKLGRDAIVSTTGGLPLANVVILVGGTVVSVGHDSILDGTVLAPKASCTVGHDSTGHGAYLCRKQITLGHDVLISAQPTTVTLP